MRYESNRDKVEEILGAAIKKKVLANALEFERILDDEFTEAKHGTLYGGAAAIGKVNKRIANAGIRDLTSEPESVQRYVLSGIGGIHRASAPGEAPAIWTGALRKGVSHVITQVTKMEWAVSIGVTLQSGRAEIAKFLEFGTSKMEPRPAWRTALQKLKSLLGG